MGELLRRIERWLHAGTPFAEVEDYINNLDEPEQVKSALWLNAWSMMPSAWQQSEASETLSALIAGRLTAVA